MKAKIKYLKKSERKIKIFGEQFVKHNKKNLKIEIDGEIRELTDYYDNKEKRNTIIGINLIGIEKVVDMSYMFKGCSSLLSIPDISKWNTSNVKNMSYMFYGCKSLSTLPDISKWNTSNVNNMSYMFHECSSLSTLPDISNWKTNDIKYII